MAKPRKPAEKPAKAPRYCISCGEVGPFDAAGLEAPLPFSWDAHLVDGELVLTCSLLCRSAEGFRERKARFHG